MAECHHETEECCQHKPTVGSVVQTIEEIDFERGIWQAAVSGNLKRVKKMINEGTNPNVTDNYGYTALVSF